MFKITFFQIQPFLKHWFNVPALHNLSWGKKTTDFLYHFLPQKSSQNTLLTLSHSPLWGPAPLAGKHWFVKGLVGYSLH